MPLLGRLKPSLAQGKHIMFNWERYVRMRPEELARCDIAAVNLACAGGLPGHEKIDPRACLKRIDEWTEKVRWATVKEYKHFERHPERYYSSRDYLRLLTMVRVLWECGVQYNPTKRAPDASVAPEDVFLFGITHGQGGTCASLPVLYAAVGGRLGYPIRLVHAKGKDGTHLFARWHDKMTYLNIEVNDSGLSCPPDSHYRSGIYTTSEQDEANGQFLGSKSPSEELAAFLMERGVCYQDVGNDHRTCEAMAWAVRHAPRNRFFLNTFKIALNRWQSHIADRLPPRFPEVLIVESYPRYPTLPKDLHRDLYGMTATNMILRDMEHEKNWWGPLRRGESPRVPVEAEATFESDGCRLRFRYKREEDPFVYTMESKCN